MGSRALGGRAGRKHRDVDASDRTPDLPFALELASLPSPDKLRKAPRQERSRALTQAILEATICVLERDGADQLNTARVAEVAGVSVGSLYQYFPNKQSLVAVVLAHYLEELSNQIVEQAQRHHQQPHDVGLRAVIAAFVRSKRDLAATSRALRPLMVTATARALVDATRRRVASAISSMIGSATDTCVRCPEETAAVLVAAVEGAATPLLVDAPSLVGSDEVEAMLTDLSIGFLRRRATASDPSVRVA